MVTDTVIAMGLDPAISISACSDSDKITELNTIMDTAMDLEEGASPTLGYALTLDRAIPIAMAMDQAAALDSNTDLDWNTAQNMDSNMGLVQPLRDTAINSEKGVDMVLDPNTSDRRSESLSLNLDQICVCS